MLDYNVLNLLYGCVYMLLCKKLQKLYLSSFCLYHCYLFNVRKVLMTLYKYINPAIFHTTFLYVTIVPNFRYFYKISLIETSIVECSITFAKNCWISIKWRPKRKLQSPHTSHYCHSSTLTCGVLGCLFLKIHSLYPLYFLLNSFQVNC